MRERSSLGFNFLMVFISNFISLFKGIFVSIAVPKILSVDGYADYRIFTLYVSYVGLFHFGLLDGFCLKYAGKTVEQIKKEKIKTYTHILFWMEIVCSLLVLLIGSLINRRIDIIIICLSVDIVFHNLASFYQNVMQSTMQFKKYARVGVLYSIFQIISVVVLLGLKTVNHATGYSYIILYLICEFLMLMTCMLSIKGLVWGKVNYRLISYKELKEVISQGFMLLIGGLIVTLILNLDRQFVAVLFSKKEYAYYSFTYSIMNIVTSLITAMSIVLFPTLKRASKNGQVAYYKKISCGIAVLVFGVLCFLPIMESIIVWILPKYRLSIDILYSIAPALATICIIQVILINFFKTFKKTKEFCLYSIIALGISFAFNYGAYILFGTMSAIAIATVLACLCWYVLCDRYLCRLMQLKNGLFIYVIFMTATYCLCYCDLLHVFYGMIGKALYMLIFALISAVFVKHEIYSPSAHSNIVS